MASLKTFQVVATVPDKKRYSAEADMMVVVEPAHYQRVTITVDLDHLAKTLAVKAATNKTGKAIEAGGAIVARIAC